MDNATLAALLADWADLLDERGESGYRSRAYRKAALAIETLDTPVADLLAQGKDLKAIQGVGPAIEARVKFILAAGGWPELEAARAQGGDGTVPTTARRRSVRDRPPRPKTGLAARLKGDLHVHTDATDGRDSLRAMVEAAKLRGLAYVAITDHSKDTRVAGGLSETAMRAHHARIRRLQDEVDGITVLAGAEVDILKDGRLDYPDSLLKAMDVVLCSIHFRHRLEKKEQMERILKGMSNEHADILTHPTTRRSGIRPGLDLDIFALGEAAAQQGWAMEMNGSPERLDLDAANAQVVAKQGVLLALDSDAHATVELDNIRHCAKEAEKAGVTDKQVLNCKDLRGLRKALRSSIL